MWGEGCGEGKATPYVNGHAYVASKPQTGLKAGCRGGTKALPLGGGVRVQGEVRVRRQGLSRRCLERGVKALEPGEGKVGRQDVGGNLQAP